MKGVEGFVKICDLVCELVVTVTRIYIKKMQTFDLIYFKKTSKFWLKDIYQVINKAWFIPFQHSNVTHLSGLLKIKTCKVEWCIDAQIIIIIIKHLDSTQYDSIAVWTQNLTLKDSYLLPRAIHFQNKFSCSVVITSKPHPKLCTYVWLLQCYICGNYRNYCFVNYGIILIIINTSVV